MSAVLAATVVYEGDVSAEIRAEMARQRLSQQHLATLLGISRQAVSRRLTEETPWNLPELEIIAAALKVPVSQFMPNPVK